MTNQLVTTDNPEAALTAAMSIVQRSGADDDRKSEYLSFRACYFSEKESLLFVGANASTLEKWREDDLVFLMAETIHLKDFQEKFHRPVLAVQAVRNFRMILKKDTEILAKWIGNQDLTKFEQNYLIKLRGAYNLEVIDKGSGGGASPAHMDFTQLVINLPNMKGELDDKNVVTLDMHGGSDSLNNGD